MAGATDELLNLAKHFKCPTCHLRKAPPRPLPARPEARPVAFNSVVHLDLKYQKDHGGEIYVALSMLDGATAFHAARVLRNRTPAHVAQRFFTAWISLFGMATTVVLDHSRTLRWPRRSRARMRLGKTASLSGAAPS
jgi:hypothetical protein